MNKKDCGNDVEKSKPGLCPKQYFNIDVASLKEMQTSTAQVVESIKKTSTSCALHRIGLNWQDCIIYHLKFAPGHEEDSALCQITAKLNILLERKCVAEN